MKSLGIKTSSRKTHTSIVMTHSASIITNSPPQSPKRLDGAIIRLNALTDRINTVAGKLGLTADRLLGSEPLDLNEADMSASNDIDRLNKGLDQLLDAVNFLNTQVDRLSVL